MKPTFAALVLTLFLALTSTALADEWWEDFTASCGDQTRECAETTKALQEEMSLLNLVNGLYLTEPQIKTIIGCAKQAGELRDCFLFENLKAVEEFKTALEELKKVLEMNSVIPKPLEERVGQKEQAVLVLRSKYFAELKKLQDKLDGVLSDGQKSVIAEFNPCIIPPANLKNPVRVGQASNTSELETHLTNLRKMPEKVFGRIIGVLTGQLIEMMEVHFGKYTDEERKAEKERLIGIVKKARAMSDEEFALNKTELAKEILKTHDDFVNSVQGFVKIVSKVTGGLTKTANFLLNPRVVPILEKRLDLMKSGVIQPVELEKLRQGETAEAG